MQTIVTQKMLIILMARGENQSCNRQMVHKRGKNTSKDNVKGAHILFYVSDSFVHLPVKHKKNPKIILKVAGIFCCKRQFVVPPCATEKRM